MRNVRFSSRTLEALEKTDDPDFSEAVIKAFRLRVQLIRAAKDERDFYAVKSTRFEKLKGKRDHQYSMRLNDQFRLVLELDGAGSDKTVVVVGIEDYH